MRTIYFFLILIIGSEFLSCKCDCPSGDMNSVTFTFNIGTSASSFTDAEVDTILLYKLTKNTLTILDSTAVFSKKFTLSETSPYFNGGSFWLNDYKVKTQGNKEFVLSDFLIESGNDQSKCKCFVNKVKKLKVDSIEKDLSGKTWSDSNVLLSR